MENVSLEANVKIAGSEQQFPNLLQPFADELLGIAARLFDVASSANKPDPLPDPRYKRVAHPNNNHLALARNAYALRRKRAGIFGNPDLFGEPAWDILLDLFIAQAEGKTVSVSSACIGSASPATTGLRWLGVLANEGLVARESDPADHRRVMVRLTGAGLTAMERFFDTVEAAS